MSWRGEGRKGDEDRNTGDSTLLSVLRNSISQGKYAGGGKGAQRNNRGKRAEGAYSLEVSDAEGRFSA